MKCLKLLVTICSCLVLLNNSNYCYSMEKQEPMINIYDDTGLQNPIFKFMLSNTVTSLEQSINKESFQKIFNEYVNAKWYTDLLYMLNIACENLKLWSKDTEILDNKSDICTQIQITSDKLLFLIQKLHNTFTLEQNKQLLRIYELLITSMSYLFYNAQSSVYMNALANKSLDEIISNKLTIPRQESNDHNEIINEDSSNNNI